MLIFLCGGFIPSVIKLVIVALYGFVDVKSEFSLTVYACVEILVTLSRLLWTRSPPDTTLSATAPSLKLNRYCYRFKQEVCVLMLDITYVYSRTDFSLLDMLIESSHLALSTTNASSVHSHTQDLNTRLHSLQTSPLTKFSPISHMIFVSWASNQLLDTHLPNSTLHPVRGLRGLIYMRKPMLYAFSLFVNCGVRTPNQS
ncbi:hypothetical protein BDR07DRAFT_865137 [Suillus spraguei]|nr:hypothetical protein BDR07DRAFT_865137 [Suillus spraguei]